MNPLITLQGVNPIQISALPKGMDIMELKMASGGIDFSNIGTVLEAAKEIRRLEAFERAIDINPSFTKAWIGKGIVCDRIKKHHKAMEAYERAVDINPIYSDLL